MKHFTHSTKTIENAITTSFTSKIQYTEGFMNNWELKFRGVLTVLALFLFMGTSAWAARAVDSLTVSAQSGTATYGTGTSSITYTITMYTSGSGSVGPSTLSVTGLPSGASGVFSPTTLTGTQLAPNPTSTLTITTSGTTPAATTSFTVSETSGGKSKTGSLVVGKAALTITASSQNKNYGTTQSTPVAGSTAFTSSGLQNSETIGSVTLTYVNNSALTATGAVGTTSIITPSAATGGTFSSANYTITYNTGVLTVVVAPLTITANNVSKTYGSTLTGGSGSTAFTSSGLVNSETIGSVTIAYGTGSAATAAVATYSGSVTPSAATGGTFSASNYSITYATGSITVNTASLTVTADNVSKTYGATLTGGSGSTAFTSSGLKNSETIGTVTITYGTGSAATASVGTYSSSVTPSAATGGTFSASNYTITYSSGSITVNTRSLTVTANNVNKTYGSSITGGSGSTAFTSSGLQNSETIGSVTITYGTGSAATAAVNTYNNVVPSAATGGTFTASNYSISYVNGNIIVGAASLTITANDVSKTYGTTITGGSGSTAFTSSGLQNSETIGTVTITYGTGSAATAAVNTYNTVVPSAATGGTFTAGNYSITYSNGTITVNTATLTITATGPSKTYGTALSTVSNSSSNFSTSGLVNSDAVNTVTLTPDANGISTTRAAGQSYEVTPSSASGTGLSNYSISYVALNGTVSTAPITVTANGVSKTYGTTITGGSGSTAFTSSGLQNSETIGSVTITYGTGSAATDAVNTYNTVVPSAATGGTFTASNYSITYANGTITVNAASLTVTANNVSKTYGTALTGGSGSTAFTSSGLQNSETIGSVTITYGTGSAATAGVNTYNTIVPSAATGGTFSAGNYSISYVSGNITVNTASLTITASGVSKTYGTALTGGSGSTAFTTSGLQNSETIGSVTITYGAGSAATDAVNTYNTIVPSAATGGTFSAGNYSITYANGTITVSEASLTITANNVNKSYGSTLTGGSGSTDFTTSGLQNSETVGSVTITYGTGSAASAAVNTYNGSVTPSAATGGTFSSGNYSITYTDGNITVTTRAVTVLGTRAFDGGTAAAFGILSITNKVGSDDVSFGSGSGTVASKNVGSQSITSFGTLALNGADAGNYTLSGASGSVNITAKAITVTADAGQSKVYGQSDPTFTYTSSPSLESGDSFSGALSRAAGSSVGTYAYTLGTLSAGSNYTLSLAAGTFAITAKAITVTPDAGQSKVYGATDPTFTYTISPALESGDGFSGALSRSSGSTVGNYAYTIGTLSASSNYTLSLAAGTFAITTKTITVTADAGQSKAYGAADPTFTYTNSPALESGDSFSGALSRVSGSSVGTYAYTLGTLSAGSNYTLSLAAGTFAITAKTITITPNAGQSKVYGATDPTFTYTNSPALESGDSFSGDLGRAAGSSVGTYAYTLGTLSAGSNYTLSLAGGSFAITAKAITVTPDAGQSKVYGQSDPTFTYTNSPALESGDAFSGALSRVSGSSVGTYAYTIGTLSAGGNYTLSLAAGTFAITAKEITVTANAGQSKVYGASDPTFTYTNSPALESGDVFSGALSRISGSSVGTYAYTIGSLSAGSNYTLSLAAGTFAITAKAITITADAGQSKVYGASDPTFTYTNSPALESGDSFSGALSRVSGSSVGTYAYTLGTLSAGSNYTLSLAAGTFAITAKTITITPNAGQSKVYGATDPTFTYTNSPALESGDSFSGDLGRAAGSSVGTYAYTLGTLSAGSNYTLSLAGGSFAITAKAITVTPDAGQSKVYGQSDPTFTYTNSPALESGDAFSGALSRVSGSSVGTYAYTIGTLSAGGNYTLSLAAGTFAITAKEITVTANAGQSKVYGASDPTFTYTNSPALESGDVFSGALSRISGSSVGTYAYTIGSLSAGSNYTLSLAAGTFAITAKAITITADAGQSKVYGTADPTFTYTNSPALESGDAFSGALSRISGSSVGTYAYTIGSLSAGSNYTLSLAAGTFAITAKTITVTANAGQSKVYGASNPTYTYTNSPALESGDNFSGALSRASGENVGTYAYSIGTLSAGSNYTLSLAAGTFAITAKAITVTANVGQSKTYGATDPTFTYTNSPALQSGDSFTGVLSRASGENVGTYAYAIGTLSAGSNYTLSLTAGTFAITAKAITVTANVGQSKAYGASNPTYTYTNSPALQSGDSFTGALSRVSGENVGTYAYTIGTLSAGTNYTLSLAAGTFAISAKVITITADANQSKVYGASNPTTYTYTNSPALQSGDNFSGGLSRTAGENVGTYSYTIGTLSAGSNYSLSLVAGTFSITAKAITITANAGQSKTYGAANPTYTYTNSPALVSGDNFTGALSRATGENVGNYAYAIGTLSAGSNYTLSLTAGTFGITAKAITVTANSGQSKTFGTSDPTFTYTNSPALISGDSFTGALSRAAGENVGTYAYSLGTLTAGGNYTLSLTAGGIFTINKALATLTLSNLTQTYDATQKSVTVTTNPPNLTVVTTTYGGSGTAPTNAGTYAIVASLTNANYQATDATGNLVINPAASTVSISAPTITYGADGLVTVSVSSSVGTVLGNVTLSVDGGNASSQPLSSGSSLFTLAGLTAGTHTLNAAYARQGNFDTSSKAGTIIVEKANTSTVLISDPNPSFAGNQVTITATVSPSTATGSVEFFKDSADVYASIGTSSIVNGVAVLAVSNFTVGTHSLTATYGSDANYNGSSSGPYSHVVNKATTTIAVISDNNPSTYQDSITLTATVSGGSLLPTGTITFMDGTTNLGDVSVDGNRNAVYGTKTFTGGTHHITVTYNGDANTEGSTSDVYDQVVQREPTTSVLTQSSSLTLDGISVTFKDSVSGSLPDGGTVQFKDGSNNLGTPITISINGVVTLTLDSLSLGDHAITAEYSGTTNYAPSNSNSVMHTVSEGPKFRTFKANSELAAKAIKMQVDSKTGKLSSKTQPVMATVLANVFNKIGNQGTTFLGVPQTNADSAKKYAWIYYKKYSSLGALYTSVHTGLPYPLDSVRADGAPTNKKLNKAVSPSRNKNNNTLWEQAVMLRLNLIASTDSVTPKGLGGLTIDSALTVAGMNMQGKTLNQLANFLDTVATYYKKKGIDSAVDITRLIPVVSVVKRINDAFYASLDISGSDSNAYVNLTKIKIEKDAYALSLLGIKTARQAAKGLLKYIPGKVSEPYIPVTGYLESVPSAFTLEQNYPNPFNPATTIAFALPENALVTVKVYNVLGQEVKTLAANQLYDAGEYEVEFDASQFASGVYLYRFSATSVETGVMTNVVKKMMLVK